MYKYKAFGLVFNSEFPIDALLPCDNINVDISVQWGSIKNRNIEEKIAYEFFHSSEREFYLDVKGIAQFEIMNGESIIVDPYENYQMSDITLYLLGSCMGALLFQRGLLPIHGSVIAIDEGCILITGNSGAGKSTLCSAFRKHGYKILTDDIAAIEIGEKILVYPSYPQHKIWRDSMDFLGESTIGLESILGRIEKYYVSYREAFYPKPMPLLAIFELSPYDDDITTLEEVNRFEAIRFMAKNTYRLQFITGGPIQSRVFKNWGAIIGNIPLYRIYRPHKKFTLDEQMQVIMKTMKLSTNLLNFERT